MTIPYKEEANRRRKLAESIAKDFFDHIESHGANAKHREFKVLYENEDRKTGRSSVSCQSCQRKLRELEVAIDLRDQVIEKLEEMLQKKNIELEEAARETQ